MKTDFVRLSIAVFLCGAVVMIYEIAGSRVVAPYIGNSLYIWTSLIGVILAALSAGYSVGGRLADRRPTIDFLALVIFGAGGLIALTILIKDPLLEVISKSSLPIEILAAVTSLVLFAPAAFFLGFVSPYAARLSISDVESSGKTVGNIYTLSTIGSIVGTFLAGFVLLPMLGTNWTLYLVVVMTFGASLLLVPDVISRIKTGSISVFLISIAFVEIQGALLYRSYNLKDIDTEYSRVRVYDFEKNEEPVRLLTTDPFSVQSSMYLKTGRSAANYTDFFDVAFDYQPRIKSVLIIGGAAMSYPKDLIRKNPGLRIDVVEIDPGMTTIAQEHFGLSKNPGFRIYHQDGRRFLNNAETNSYDLVAMDAFNSMLYVPFHLTTKEALTEIRRVLKPNGVYIANVSGAIVGPGSLFSKASKKTIGSIFQTTRVHRVLNSKKSVEMQSLVFVASDEELRLVSGADEKFAGSVVDLDESDGLLLTDDFAPVERFMSIAFANRKTR